MKSSLPVRRKWCSQVLQFLRSAFFLINVFYLQQIKFKSQLEQQRLQLQREHSSEMEQILEKVSVYQGPYCSRLTSH